MVVIKKYFLIVLFCPLVISAQKTLDLSYQELSEIPQSVRKMHNLEELDISENPLQKLPDWLYELKNLKIIRLDKVTSLAPNEAFKIFTTCENLEEIYWNDAQLIYLPIAVNELKNLKKIEISGNGILKLPPFKNNTTIEYLDVSNNLLDTLDLTFTALKKLNHLNFSYNPGMENKYNYHLLSFLSNLNTLIVDGINSVPIEINKLKNLNYLSLNNGSFTVLPDIIIELKILNRISVKDCPKLDLSILIEQLSALPQLQTLQIGYEGFTKIPFNLFKLTALKNLSIDKSCLNYFPESFSKLNLHSLLIQNCTMNNFPDLIVKIGSIKTLKKLSLINLQTNENNWDFTAIKNLETLDISNNHLKKNPIGIQNTTVLNSLGNEIFNSFELKENVFKNQKYKEHNDIKTYRKTIYTQIGEGFYYNGLYFNIPPLAFVDKNGKTITEEIELTIQIIENPLDIAKSNLPLYNKNFSPLDLDFGVNITCYYKKAICYLKTDKSIGISKVLNNNNQIEFYNYNAFKNKLEPIKLKPLACELNSETLKNYNFKSSVSSNKNEYPELSFQVKTSKVHISLKKNLKKNTLNFDITPVYGYKENFFQLYGDRIKGYPELKNYEEIRWDYVGENLEDDLKKIYFLSEQAKTEKLERSSTFYFYVLDIKDIFLIPHPNKDSYVLNIVQGLDTIKLEVLPYIKTVHLKKIQKWHEKKFEKYSSELLERKKYWIKLDSLYLNQYEDLEEKLNDFKTFVVNTEDHKIWNGNDGEEIKSDGTLFEINKTGLYLITQPLSINDFSIHNFQFEILGHKHFPKYVLIHNAISNHTYWQESNNVRIEKKGLSSIYSLVGDVLYYGIFENKDLIQLNKFKK